MLPKEYYNKDLSYAVQFNIITGTEKMGDQNEPMELSIKFYRLFLLSVKNWRNFYLLTSYGIIHFDL